MHPMTAEPPMRPTKDILDALVRIVGEANAISEPEAMTPYLVEWRDRYHGKAALVLRPGSTAEVASILKLANETRTAIVPQGGNTGLVGGQIPFESGNEVVVSLEPPHSRPRHRSLRQQHDRRGRPRARQGAKRGGERRPPLPLEPRFGGKLPDRRRACHQCRGHDRCSLTAARAISRLG